MVSDWQLVSIGLGHDFALYWDEILAWINYDDKDG